MTLMDISLAPAVASSGSRGAVELAEVGVEVGEARTDGALMLVAAGEGVGGLEAVAGDAGDG